MLPLQDMMNPQEQMVEEEEELMIQEAISDK